MAFTYIAHIAVQRHAIPALCPTVRLLHESKLHLLGSFAWASRALRSRIEASERLAPIAGVLCFTQAYLACVSVSVPFPVYAKQHLDATNVLEIPDM